MHQCAVYIESNVILLQDDLEIHPFSLCNRSINRGAVDIGSISIGIGLLDGYILIHRRHMEIIGVAVSGKEGKADVTVVCGRGRIYPNIHIHAVGIHRGIAGNLVGSAQILAVIGKTVVLVADPGRAVGPVAPDLIDLNFHGFHGIETDGERNGVVIEHHRTILPNPGEVTGNSVHQIAVNIEGSVGLLQNDFEVRPLPYRDGRIGRAGIEVGIHTVFCLDDGGIATHIVGEIIHNTVFAEDNAKAAIACVGSTIHTEVHINTVGGNGIVMGYDVSCTGIRACVGENVAVSCPGRRIAPVRPRNYLFHNRLKGIDLKRSRYRIVIDLNRVVLPDTGKITLDVMCQSRTHIEIYIVILQAQLQICPLS